MAIFGTKTALIADMKVIVQDATTKRYLSATGGWVATENDAQDFLSLLRAYNFATHFTSRRFGVVLYCPDDNYRTTIIEGEGKVKDEFSGELRDGATVKQASHQQASTAQQWSRFNTRMTSTRHQLN